VKRYEAQPIKTAPRDGSMIAVVTYVRWQPYKPASEQYRNGTKGRWQSHNGYGWENMDGTPEEWLAPVEGDAA